MAFQDRPFDLVALDLDGTILDQHRAGGFSPRVRAAIAAVQARGVRVTIATGRVLDYVRPRAVDLGITTPVVTAQGAIIGDPRTGAVLYEALMPLDAARRVAAWADRTGRVTIFYFSDGRGGTLMAQNREEWAPEVYDYWFGAPRRIEPVLSELFATPDVRPLKFITVNEVANEADLAPTLRDRFEPTLHISRTHAQLVEGTAAGVDKGSGLLHLAERLGIDPARTLAIGDNENDIPMLQRAGLGVAMGQATEIVKAAADWVAPAIAADGAAVAMEKFVLGGSFTSSGSPTSANRW